MPVRSWYGIRDARRMGQSCVQGGMITKPIYPTRDVEDCLNMNIYTPANRMNVQYPVMFFVHGGFFSTGSNAEYPASYLLERDIILVVPNYRLDALGKLITRIHSQKNLQVRTEKMTTVMEILNFMQVFYQQNHRKFLAMLE